MVDDALVIVPTNYLPPGNAKVGGGTYGNLHVLTLAVSIWPDT